MNVGQLKYIASLIYGQLNNAGYTGLYPPWIAPNPASDTNAANIGEGKRGQASFFFSALWAGASPW